MNYHSIMKKQGQNKKTPLKFCSFKNKPYLCNRKNGLRGEFLNIFKLLRTFLNNLGAFMARGDVNPSFPNHGFGRLNNSNYPIIDIFFQLRPNRVRKVLY